MTVSSLNKIGFISYSTHWILRVEVVKPSYKSVSPWNRLGLIPNSGESSGGARGARPLIFRPNWGPKAPPPLSQGMDPALPKHLQSAASLITLQDRMEDSAGDNKTSALWPYTRTMSDCSDVSLIVWEVLWAYYWQGCLCFSNVFLSQLLGNFNDMCTVEPCLKIQKRIKFKEKYVA